MGETAADSRHLDEVIFGGCVQRDRLTESEHRRLEIGGLSGGQENTVEPPIDSRSIIQFHVHRLPTQVQASDGDPGHDQQQINRKTMTIQEKLPSTARAHPDVQAQLR